MCLTYILAQKAYRIPYEIRKLGIAIIIAALIVLVGTIISDKHILFRFSIKIGMLISYPFILLLFDFYEQAELDAIRKIFYSWRNPKKLRENIKRLLK